MRPDERNWLIIRNRCPVCGMKGFRRARVRPGALTIFWCQRGHPHHIIGFDDA